MQKRRHKLNKPRLTTAPTSLIQKAAADPVSIDDQHTDSRSVSFQIPTPAEPAPSEMPNAVVRRLVTAILLVHFVAITISFLAVVEPSSIQSRVLGYFEPYLLLTHFGSDNRPIYLAHGETTEQPHRIEWSELAEPTSSDWQLLGSDATAGLAAADRSARFLSTAAALAESESSSVVADLLLPIVRHEPKMRAIRIVRLPTELTTVVDDLAPPPYVARVLRNDSEVQVVQLKSARLVTAHAPQPVNEK